MSGLPSYSSLFDEQEQPSGGQPSSLGPLLPPITQWPERFARLCAPRREPRHLEEGPPPGEDELSAMMDARATILAANAAQGRAWAAQATSPAAPKAIAQNREATARALRSAAERVREENLFHGPTPSVPTYFSAGPAVPIVEAGGAAVELRRNPNRGARRRSTLPPMKGD
ncbi:MAG: hypothetical protein M1837_004006 [Sclerophora amabilis]|nr:MAG: hypothetical protein M1837_004006 [Sclerophora amabilis]